MPSPKPSRNDAIDWLRALALHPARRRFAELKRQSHAAWVSYL